LESCFMKGMWTFFSPCVLVMSNQIPFYVSHASSISNTHWERLEALHPASEFSWGWNSVAWTSVKQEHPVYSLSIDGSTNWKHSLINLLIITEVHILCMWQRSRDGGISYKRVIGCGKVKVKLSLCLTN
jgi:hypothetical protein